MNAPSTTTQQANTGHDALGIMIANALMAKKIEEQGTTSPVDIAKLVIKDLTSVLNIEFFKALPGAIRVKIKSSTSDELNIDVLRGNVTNAIRSIISDVHRARV